MAAPVTGELRMGAFSRRVGVSPAVLRAWEARYGLFTPRRTAGGFRLYSAEDESRVRRMLAHLGAGVAARESAQLVLAAPSSEALAIDSLTAAWSALDGAEADRALDGLLDGPEAARTVSDAILPALRRAADEWRGQTPLATARCQLASRQLEARLLALGAGWHQNAGPLALVGCGPGEHHTLGALTFALALHVRGWRIAYLGADTPVDGFLSATRALGPALVTIAFTMARPGNELRPMAAEFPLAVAGPGVDSGAARAARAAWFPASPAAAAEGR
jgi:MerR family transcriptional regulator, light-induced transcriptional regulator